MLLVDAVNNVLHAWTCWIVNASWWHVWAFWTFVYSRRIEVWNSAKNQYHNVYMTPFWESQKSIAECYVNKNRMQFCKWRSPILNTHVSIRFIHHYVRGTLTASCLPSNTRSSIVIAIVITIMIITITAYIGTKHSIKNIKPPILMKCILLSPTVEQ